MHLNLSQYTLNYYFATSWIRKEPYNNIFLFKLPSFVLLSYCLHSFKGHGLVLSVVQHLSFIYFVQFYSYLWQAGKFSTFISVLVRTGSPCWCLAIHCNCYCFWCSKCPVFASGPECLSVCVLFVSM